MSPIPTRGPDEYSLVKTPREVTIRDGVTVPVDVDDDRNDILWHQLKKSVKQTANRRAS